MRNVRSLFLALAFSLPCVLGAFELSPISLTLRPKGEDSNGVVRLKNPHQAPKAVQVSITTRNPDELGEETNRDDDDNFLVYPPQLILMPRETQVVRISWIGAPELKKELTYRFVAEELNVELDEAKAKEQNADSAIRLLMKYEGALYVAPEDAKPKLSLVFDKEQAAEDQLAFRFINEGTRHQVLYNLHVTLEQNDQKILLSPTELTGINGSNILPEKSRTFTIALPENFQKDKEFSYNFSIDDWDE